MSAREHKLIFTGTMGAGKTTAISAISEIAPIRTDVQQHGGQLAGSITHPPNTAPSHAGPPGRVIQRS